MRKDFKGVWTALITPMNSGGAVDYKALDVLLQRQISAGIHGLVVLGTTAETATLSHEEQTAVAKFCLARVGEYRYLHPNSEKVPVIIGAGKNSTAETIDLSQHFQDLGADGLLIVAPYYNRPSATGLYEHFKAAAQSVDIPVIIYNIPSRTGVDVSDATIVKITGECINVVGIKDATGSMIRALELMALLPNFNHLSGDDATFGLYLASGGGGCISVVSNLVPKLSLALYLAWQNTDIAKFLMLQQKYFQLSKALFWEANPAPVKYALSILGICQNFLRLPMCRVSPMAEEIIQKALEDVKDFH